MHPIVSKLLRKRGISESDQEAFLHPDFLRDTHDGGLLLGMNKAVAALGLAIQKKQKIAVFGDYDADGVPATAVVVRAMRGLGIEVFPYIPTRADGYGLSQGVVDRLITDKVELLITVDNGTVSEEPIKALLEAGIPTIVCDHHEPQADHIAHSALAILNPKQTACTYPFKELCGCALAWKLMVELYKQQGKDWNLLKWELDLVAFSTIADMVPLVGENRTLVVYGLQVLRQSRNLGLQALAKVAGVTLLDISAGKVSFQLAPRVNAPSRMHSELVAGAHSALSLLTTNDKDEAGQLAEMLNQHNLDRQTLLETHLQEARSLADGYKDDLCVVVYGEDWSTGVVGLVAGRLLEVYARPIVVLAREGEQIKGSVRSVDGVHAVEWLAAAEDSLAHYGGHAKAAGLTLDNQDIDLLRLRLNTWLQEKEWKLEDMAAAHRRKPDIEISLQEVDMQLAEGLMVLEPYGVGFPSPLFSSVCEIDSVRKVGKSQQHLACFLVDGSIRKKAIAFGKGSEVIEIGKKYEVEYAVEIEEWNNIRSVGCQIRRLQPVKDELS